MALPSDLPEWASGGSAVVINPTTAKKAAGWVNSEKPPAGFLNWLAYTTYLWLVQLKALFLGTVTVKSLQADGTGGGAATAAAGDVVASGNVTAGATVSGNTVAVGSGGESFTIGATAAGYFLIASAQTTNNSVTPALTWTVPTNKAIIVSGQIIGYKSDFTDAEAVYFRQFGAEDAAGVLTQFAAGTVESTKDDAAWGTSGPAVTANLFIVNVQGKAATTINWKVMVWITVV